jgi:hypothetical protein
MPRYAWMTTMCAILAVVATGQEPASVKVKGHVLGETVAEFSQRFGCARLLALSRKEAKHEQAVGDVAECRLLANPPTGRFTVSLSGSKDDPLMAQDDVEGQILFHDGAAAAITVITPTWSALYAEVVEKYGKPSRTTEEKRQNFHGAVFTLHSAIWELPTGVTIVALEEFDPQFPQTKATFFAPGEAKKLAAESPNRKSALDSP